MKLIFLLSLIIIQIISENVKLQEMIDFKEAAVQRFVTAVQTAFAERCVLTQDCTCSYSACQSSSDTLTCNRDANPDECFCKGMMMDSENSVVRIPEGLDTGINKNPEKKDIKESICYTKNLEEIFVELETESPEMEWQGFGSWNGMFRIYPGRAQKECGNYDPRSRSWYVSASSGPKDVVIIMDMSGSMDNPFDKRWELAIESLKEVLKALTIGDHVNVVFFSDTAFVVTGSKLSDSGEVLLRATSQNKKLLNERIDAIKPLGKTDCHSGFQRAFQLLEDSYDLEISSNCEKVILFLTDGTCNEGLVGKNLVDYVTNINAGNYQAKIFSFSYGDNADKDVPKNISCGNEGVWTGIVSSQYDNLRSQMSTYYDYLSIAMAEDVSQKYFWVEPYNFATDGKLGTSVSSPVYSYATNPPLFLGVAGTGFSLDEFKRVEADEEKLLDELILRSSYCPTKTQLTTCQLESLRARKSANSRCDLGSCGTLVDLNPKPCPAKDYANDLWCNVNNAETLYDDKSCCSCHAKNFMLFVFTPASIIVVIIIIIVILVICYIVYKKKSTNVQKLKTETHEVTVNKNDVVILDTTAKPQVINPPPQNVQTYYSQQKEDSGKNLAPLNVGYNPAAFVGGMVPEDFSY